MICLLRGLGIWFQGAAEFARKKKQSPWENEVLQGGPLPVVNGATTPTKCLINGFAWGYSSTCRGYNLIYNDRRGPPCSTLRHFLTFLEWTLQPVPSEWLPFFSWNGYVTQGRPNKLQCPVYLSWLYDMYTRAIILPTRTMFRGNPSNLPIDLSLFHPPKMGKSLMIPICISKHILAVPSHLAILEPWGLEPCNPYNPPNGRLISTIRKCWPSDFLSEKNAKGSYKTKETIE